MERHEVMTVAKKHREHFTVDSALLRELGERLVGAPYIALAELIKNSYDADASHVDIKFEDDRIDVSDDGHGMDYGEFRDRWMRVGSPHKAREEFSRNLRRPLTGSKGVGRLAVQFLGNQLEMRTTSAREPLKQLTATVNWREAVQAGELTSATALYEVGAPTASYPGGSPSGTTISIEGLNQTWERTDFEKLAREIWFLRPPFSDALVQQAEPEGSFDVHLDADRPDKRAFETQLRRVLDLWMARIHGVVKTVSEEPRRSMTHLVIEFQGSRATSEKYDLPPSAEEASQLFDDAGLDLGNESLIDGCQFEIRIFDLRYKQRFGIKVKEARDYLQEHGGVHVYDGGFRIPFSGPEADWLGLEIAHSHRLETTRLLPAALRVSAAATYLPTNSRVFGAVHIDTSKERRAAHRPDASDSEAEYSDHLQIQVSRDRLVRNRAYEQLRYVVIRALEHYATEQAKHRLEDIARIRDVQSPSEAVDSALEILSHYKSEMSSEAYSELEVAIDDAVKDARQQAQLQQDLASQLAAFASAGSLTLVYDHEVSRQIVGVERIARKLRRIARESPQTSAELEQIAADIDQWVLSARGIRSLVRHLSEVESRDKMSRYKLMRVLDDAGEGARYLTRGIPLEFSAIPDEVRLPRGLYAGWIALFQNLFVNAANAIIAQGDPGRIAVSYSVHGNRHMVRIQDTGIGVNLTKAESLFEPFTRNLKIPASRRALAAGGTGLGLTIVKMIANDANADVRFVQPDPPFATAVRLQWKERP
ncbi:MAG: hypothetical protein F4144_14875 [Acidimicrobiaceae bacterium]|nr:hypothetical protein [Acidimicrobiaceae bacterium]